MVINNNYQIDVTNLSLVKFEMDVKTSDIVEIILEKLTDDEMKLVGFLTSKLPFRSSMEDDDTYWDIILLDENIRMFLEHVLTKYGIEYRRKNITELYYNKSSELDKTFITEIDEYLEENLDIDTILDRISSIGIERLNQYELEFLEKQSKKD